MRRLLSASFRRAVPQAGGCCHAPRHVASGLVGQSVIDAWVTGKHGIPVDSLWSQVANPMKLIDEFAHRTNRKRHLSVGSMLHFLGTHNVILHAMMHFDATRKDWVAHKTEFMRLCVVGEALLQDEVTLRLVRLFPDAPFDQVDTLRREALSKPRLVEWFDNHAMKVLFKPKVSRRAIGISDDVKVRFVYATLAELNWFVIKTKATDRTHNNALFPPSDALILHVLAAHVVECTCSGLTVEPLLPCVADAKRRWANQSMSLTSQFHEKRPASKRLALLSAPLKRLPEGATVAEDGDEAPLDVVVGPTREMVAFTAVSAAPPQPSLRSEPVAPLWTPTDPNLRWSKMLRSHLAPQPLAGECVVEQARLASEREVPAPTPSTTEELRELRKSAFRLSKQLLAAA